MILEKLSLLIKISNRSFLTEAFLVSFTEYLMLGAIFIVNIILNKTYGTASLGEFNVGYSLSQILTMRF